MAQELFIELEISAPIELQLVVDKGYAIVPSFVPGAEPLFTASEAFKLTPGDKIAVNEYKDAPDLVIIFENNLI